MLAVRSTAPSGWSLIVFVGASVGGRSRFLCWVGHWLRELDRSGLQALPKLAAIERAVSRRAFQLCAHPALTRCFPSCLAQPRLCLAGEPARLRDRPDRSCRARLFRSGASASQPVMWRASGRCFREADATRGRFAHLGWIATVAHPASASRRHGGPWNGWIRAEGTFSGGGSVAAAASTRIAAISRSQDQADVRKQRSVLPVHVLRRPQPS